MAIASGIAGGLGLGESAQFALVTRGLNELRRMGSAMGAREETMVGLSGLGDLMLSCSSPTSRNYSYGFALATGQDMTDHPLAEGIFTCEIAHSLAEEQALDMPIVAAVAQVLKGELSPEQAVDSLLRRPLRTESD
jgi:glycerol-3-phosphate dehydrogenase (NAD(P)+)